MRTSPVWRKAVREFVDEGHDFQGDIVTFLLDDVEELEAMLGAAPGSDTADQKAAAAYHGLPDLLPGGGATGWTNERHRDAREEAESTGFYHDGALLAQYLIGALDEVERLRSLAAAAAHHRAKG